MSRASGGQTVSADGAYRLDFWRQAFAAFRDHPTTGTGYGRILTSTKSSSSAALLAVGPQRVPAGAG